MAACRAGGRNPGFGRCPGASAQWPREISTGTILAVGREKRSPRSVSGSSRIERCGDRFIQQVRICAVGPPAELLFPSHRSRFTAKTQTHRLVPKYPWFALDSRFAWSYVRLRRARLPAKARRIYAAKKLNLLYGGGTHGRNPAEPSGHTPRYRRRLSASVRGTRKVRFGTAAHPQRTLPEFGRPPGRN